MNGADPNGLPPSVNYHILSTCNMRCRFCFATFADLGDQKIARCGLPGRSARRIVAMLAEHFEKITFVGGEPTLRGDLLELLEAAHVADCVTMLVTNGSRLIRNERLLSTLAPRLDWLALSVDSADPMTQRRLGRTVAGHVHSLDEYIDLARRVRAAGIRLKLNTVVAAPNVSEDMSGFVSAMQPDRWKIFQSLPVKGQNDDCIADLAVGADAFGAFVSRHRKLSKTGVTVVAERNEDMTGSYAMVSPDGRFFDNTVGRHTYSARILAVGVNAAWSQIHFDSQRYEARGGRYTWDGRSRCGPSEPACEADARKGVPGAETERVVAQCERRMT